MRKSGDSRPIAPCTDKTTLEAFLADKCEATKEKYAAEMENASDEWRSPLDHWYAESLVHFGLLERRVETLYADGVRVRGSRAWFKKAPKCTTRVYKSAPFQTEMAV
jgi:hypothetical protein